MWRTVKLVWHDWETNEEHDKDCVNEEFNLDWAKLGKNDGAVESLSDCHLTIEGRLFDTLEGYGLYRHWKSKLRGGVGTYNQKEDEEM